MKIKLTFSLICLNILVLGYFSFLIGMEVAVIKQATLYEVSPLHVAIMEGDEQAVSGLLQSGVDVNQQYNGMPVLCAAIMIGKESILELLLKSKQLDVNVVDAFGNTPLILASKMCQLSIVLRLLKFEVEVSKKNNKKRDAFHYVIKRNGINRVLKLQAMNALLCRNNACQAFGEAIICQWVKADLLRGSKALVFPELLIDAVKGDCEYLVKLLLAMGVNAQSRYKVMEEFLIVKDADISNADKDGRSLLHFAVSSGHKEVVELVLAKGANIEAADNNGETSLWCACWKGHREVVQLLLERGANIEAADNRRRTPLISAVWNGHREVVELLLTRNADIRAVDSSGDSSLHCASRGGCLNIVRLLLKKDADVRVVNRHGDTPLHMASWHDNRDVVELLLANHADIAAVNMMGDTPLFCASQLGSANVVELLLNKGAKVKDANKTGYTVLHCAAEEGHRKVIELLLAKGADVLARTTSLSYAGSTPLHIAVRAGHTDVVELLLKKGADPKIKNCSGRLAEDFAQTDEIRKILKAYEK